jgi:hypothetical protein
MTKGKEATAGRRFDQEGEGHAAGLVGIEYDP